MAKVTDATLITSAGRGHSLDLAERQRRYVITMSIRTACFLLFLIVPGWWKVLTLVLAAFLPALAVLLANNTDHRPPPTVSDDPPAAGLAITTGVIVRGDVIVPPETEEGTR